MQRLADFIAGIDGVNRRRAWQRHIDALPDDAARAWDDLLGELPIAAWSALKESTLRQIDRHNPARGWHQALDRFNEARAFLYLQALGYESVAFAPSSVEAAGPDLLARRGAMKIACEVKSIRLDAASAHLGRKLAPRLQDASTQLAATGADLSYIYLVVVGGDVAAVRAALAATDLPACRVVVDCGGLVETIS